MRVILIHWNAAEAEQRADRLRSIGHEPTVVTSGAEASTRRLSAEAPEAIVIDLSRLPSHGRMIATLIRQSKSLRGVPLVFVDGPEEKVAAVKALLPDATYATWGRLRSALKAAVANPPARPVVPKETSYSTTPLWQKLAIKPGARVVLVDPPAGFVDLLDGLPEGARLLERPPGDLTIWFVRRADDLESDLDRVVRIARPSPLWIASPKASAGARGGLTQSLVRDVGLALGLVDYKVCSIDAAWSALLFKTPASLR